MNFEFAEQIIPNLEKLDFVNALKTAETELKKLDLTDFHEVLNKSLVGQADELANWIEEFYNKALDKAEVETLYFEMNEFDINTDQWYIDSFAFRKDGGLDLEDMEWLCDFDTDSQSETGTIFIIEGYEKLQNSFARIEEREENETWTNNLQNARDWCEQIILIRYMELMKMAHSLAKKRNLKWATIPIYFTEHAYDFVVKSENNKAEKSQPLTLPTSKQG